MVGHLDFFPNGGQYMPGCKKNVLSQIVDIDGIWSGKAVGTGGAASLGYSAFAITDLCVCARVCRGACVGQWKLCVSFLRHYAPL